MTEKLKDAVYGFIVGDALGVPFEFKKRRTFECKDMIGYGTWNQEEGTWSDDSSMMLATLESIKRLKKVDAKDIFHNFEKWYYNNEFSPNNDVFDVGRTTRIAIETKVGQNDIRSNGNGSLMRILPLGFISLKQDDISNVSSLTHAHQISINSCIIYVNIIKELLKGINIKSILEEFKDYKAPFNRLHNIYGLKEEDIKSTGYVIDTLEAALWCITTSNSYKEAVLKAVNLGDDTDTVAAITGGLAGIIYGFDAIPSEWIKKIKNKVLIDSTLF